MVKLIAMVLRHKFNMMTADKGARFAELCRHEREVSAYYDGRK